MSVLTPPLTPGELRLSPPTTPFKAAFTSALQTPPDTPAGSDLELKRLSIVSSTSSSSSSSPGKATETSRPLSDNELSYFLPSRADGVNDMYLHHRLTAPANLMDRERVLHVWALQLLKNPLLASQIAFGDYEDVSFVHSRPRLVSSTLDSAEDRFLYLPESDASADIIGLYLNGPRSLSSDRLAMLVVADKGEGSYEVMLCATHYLGDGMALHTFMNEFYQLLGDTANTVSAITASIRDEIARVTGIPPSLEDRMPKVGNGSALARAIGAVDNRRNDSKLIGGQAFPGAKIKKQRHTLVPTFAYSEAETKAILGKCKANGATIAHAMFALCNIAWARRIDAKARVDPSLIYSALNLRPNMLPAAEPTSYFHLAVGYFNIVLPSLIPAELSTAELFWHRARTTKAQTVKAVKSQFVVARSRETNRLRRDRAVKWARIDDEEEAKAKAAAAAVNHGLGLGLPQPDREAPRPETATAATVAGPKIAPVRAEQATPATPKTPATAAEPAATSPAVLPPASQRALMGVSMLGNLDGMYAHKSFGDITLSSLTTGSRQRSGGLLLFAYTFVGKLWMSLGYDQNGFEEGAIEGFWQEVQDVAKEVLL